MRIQDAISRTGKKVVMKFNDDEKLVEWSRKGFLSEVNAKIEYGVDSNGDKFRSSTIHKRRGFKHPFPFFPRFDHTILNRNIMK